MSRRVKKPIYPKEAFTILEAILAIAIALFVVAFIVYFFKGEKPVSETSVSRMSPTETHTSGRGDRSAGTFSQNRRGGDLPVPGGGSVGSTSTSSTKLILSDIPVDKRQILEDFKKAFLSKDPLQLFSKARIAQLSQDDLKACLEYVSGMEPGPAATKFLKEIVSEWAIRDPVLAAKYVCNTSSLRLRSDLLNSVVSVWGEKDMKAALAFVESLDSQYTRRNVVSNLLNKWAESDPESVFEWYQSSTNRDGRYLYSISASLFSIFTKEDPSMAVARAWSLSEHREKVSAIRTIAIELMQNDNIEVLMNVYAGMSESPDRSVLGNEIARQLARYQPARAMEWVNNSIVDLTERENVLNTLIGIWSSDQPEQAAKWIMTELPDNDEKGRHLSSAVSAWIRDNPVEAVNWLSEYPSSSLTDASAQIVARELVRSSPETAFIWAESITELNMRNMALRQVATQWMSRDPEKATAYIQASNLSEVEKERILSSQDRGNWRRPGGSDSRFRRDR